MQQYLFFIIYGIFVVVNILDCVTTVQALKNGATEANPVMKKVMDTIGIIPALVVDADGAGAICVFAQGEVE